MSLRCLYGLIVELDFFFGGGGVGVGSVVVFYCTIFGFVLQFDTLNAISALLFR